MAKRKYVTGNKSVDAEIGYLQVRFPNNPATTRQVKYLVNRFGAQTTSGKAERARTSARSSRGK